MFLCETGAPVSPPVAICVASVLQGCYTDDVSENFAAARTTHRVRRATANDAVDDARTRATLCQCAVLRTVRLAGAAKRFDDGLASENREVGVKPLWKAFSSESFLQRGEWPSHSTM